MFFLCFLCVARPRGCRSRTRPLVFGAYQLFGFSGAFCPPKVPQWHNLSFLFKAFRRFVEGNFQCVLGSLCSCRFLTFWVLWGLHFGPFWGALEVKSGHFWIFLSGFPPRSRASRPESPPEDPQGRPGPPKDLILGAFGPVLGGILDHFGMVWGTSWV